MSEIKIENLNLKFGSKTILEDINLEIGVGEYVGLIGPNGAGKSSLLKCILGLMSPSSGKITIHDNMKFSYVPQYFLGETGFSISVLEVISMGLANKSIFNKSQNLNDINSALKKVDLKQSVLKENFLNLSGGQKQRVVIARALVNNPNFLIFDEAFSNVDMTTKTKIYELLARINREDNTTILFVSHEVDTIIQKCKRVICLNKHLHEGCHPIKFMEGKLQKIDNIPVRINKIHHHHNHEKC
ncbi:ATP-binding cassette domain-containing protein [bacterium]|jgi:zinc transport system ATP-binding protein|nr:ATP-binding cassette domain-containing protein [bacterium]MBT6293390.1 ATP-binding cassette domain-containing protein [bacterium]